MVNCSPISLEDTAHTRYAAGMHGDVWNAVSLYSAGQLSNEVSTCPLARLLFPNR